MKPFVFLVLATFTLFSPTAFAGGGTHKTHGDSETAAVMGGYRKSPYPSAAARKQNLLALEMARSNLDEKLSAGWFVDKDQAKDVQGLVRTSSRTLEHKELTHRGLADFFGSYAIALSYGKHTHVAPRQTYGDWHAESSRYFGRLVSQLMTLSPHFTPELVYSFKHMPVRAFVEAAGTGSYYAGLAKENGLDYDETKNASVLDYLEHDIGHAIISVSSDSSLIVPSPGHVVAATRDGFSSEAIVGKHSMSVQQFRAAMQSNNLWLRGTLQRAEQFLPAEGVRLVELIAFFHLHEGYGRNAETLYRMSHEPSLHNDFKTMVDNTLYNIAARRTKHLGKAPQLKAQLKLYEPAIYELMSRERAR